MAQNLRDAWLWIEKLIKRIERLESGTMLENSSITEGRMRFIGGLLLIDSGGTLQLVGTLTGNGSFDWTGTLAQAGQSTFTGPTTFTGQLTVNGPWKFVGNGEITGDVTVTGDITLLGDGRIKAGNMIIDPSNGGSVTFPGGAKLAVGLTGGSSSIGMIPGGSVDVSANTLTAWMRAIGAAISVSTATARIAAANVLMPDIPSAPSGVTTVAVVIDPSTGKLYRS